MVSCSVSLYCVPINKVTYEITLEVDEGESRGSGGDNFFDAGSCIDGRLTSAWNWCSQLSRKAYYPMFKLTGFSSFEAFDG